MKKTVQVVIGMLTAGLVLPSMGFVVNFESDVVGSTPSALLWSTQQVTVVASGTDGITAPDGSAKYAKAVYDITGWSSTYWTHEMRAIPESIEGDLYIDTNAVGGGSIATTVVYNDGSVNGLYKGEYPFGYYKGTDGLMHVGVDSKMPPSYASTLPSLASGWYHFKMLSGDSDSDGMLDFTVTMTDTIGNVMWTGIKKTSHAVAGHLISGAQVYLNKSGAVVRVDNLRTSANELPVALASANPSTGTTADEFFFSGASSYDPDGTIAAYTWQINGSEAVSTAEDFLYTFAAAGTYTVTLTVTDNYGATSSDELTVIVTEPISSVVSVTVSDTTAGEPGLPESTGKFKISRSGDLTKAIVVKYAMSGTAANGTDYTLLGGTVTLAIGKASATVTVTPKPDALSAEGTETAVMTLNTGSGYSIDSTKASGVVAIKDQTYGTPVVSATVTDATAVEPGLSVNKGAIKISRTQSLHTTLTVLVAVSGTAANGLDFNTVVTPVVLSIGQSAKTISIAPRADAEVEGDETVTMTIVPDAAYLIGAAAAGTVTIKDNTLLGTPVVSIVAADAYAVEPKPGVSNNGKLTFSRTSRFHEALVINYVISGSASNGTDYKAITSTITIPAGAASKSVTVTPKADTVTEGLETVTLTLGASGTYTINVAKAAATVTIAE